MIGAEMKPDTNYRDISPLSSEAIFHIHTSFVSYFSNTPYPSLAIFALYKSHTHTVEACRLQNIKSNQKDQKT